MRKVNIKSPGTFLGVLKLYIYISGQLYGEKYSRMDQVKIVEDSL